MINPRRACARVTVVTVCVYPSVTNDTVSLRLFLDFDSWIFEKTFRSKVIA